MTTDMQTLVTFAKTKGFVYQGSEIYGGLANSWDYAPLGALLKENIKNLWIKNFVQKRRDMVLLDSAILMNPQVWVASGHVGGFSDPLIDDKNTKERFRADKLLEDLIEKMGADAESLKTKYGVNNLIPESWPLEKQTEVMRDEKVKNPNTGEVGDWSDAKQFNLMFKTSQGVTEDSSATVYLRPETAQGIFVNFSQVARTSRKKVPFGIAQVGKSFRNEITPGNFIFRTREFEQMEIEFFCEPESVAPGKHLEWHEFWKKACWDFLVKTIGIAENSLRMRDHEPDELSHYSDATTDIEFQFPFGWGELWGIADRTDFDLRAHMNESKQDLSYFDPYNNTKYVPYVIEPSVGLTRLFLAVLTNAYTEIENNEGKRVVMRFAPAIAPIKVAIYPLVKKFANEASELYELLSEHFVCEYDEAGTIGKRYQRSEEMGIPFAIAVEPENYNQGQVTVRFRDSGEQEIVKIENLVAWLKEKGC
ncbi:glycine--tRNA ligase [Candidatus Gracilibacteria bacterium GN02-873]|nr:glycine--tRNA ligase [Candidatus Gracilibacteria bacterium GN02-873]